MLRILTTILLLLHPLYAQQQEQSSEVDSTQLPVSTIRLLADSIVVPGDTFSVSVSLCDTSVELGGFNLLIEYDYGDLVLDSATQGELTAGSWEYFEYRHDPLYPEDPQDTRAYLRLVSIADMHHIEGHPDSASIVGPGELVRISFYVADRLADTEKRLQLRFLWQQCGDNSLADKSGNRLFLARHLFAAGGTLLKKDSSEYSGPAVECFTSAINPPLPLFDFQNLEIVARSAILEEGPDR